MDMNRDELISNILTSREHMVYLGGSPMQTHKTTEDWDIPEGILLGNISKDQAMHERERIGHITSFVLESFFQLPGHTGIKLPPLDVRGITVSNPQIVEIDKETGKIIRELPPQEQKRYLDHYKKIMPDLPPERIEGNSPTSSESKK